MDLRDGIAWVAEEVTGLWSRDTESGASHFRITTGWEEEGGEWKIRHAHIDLPWISEKGLADARCLHLGYVLKNRMRG